MQGYSIAEKKKPVFSAEIKIIGAGGGGGNMINHIVRTMENSDKVDLIVANTDKQALNGSSVKLKIQLGNNGLGAGMDPEVGKAAAEESYEDIKDALSGADVVFVSAGLGGGTGTGAAPVIARAAKEQKALTIGVVTTPFSFEGNKRMRLAQEGIAELKKECDSIIVIPNQKLLSLVDKKAGFKEAFKMVDSVLTQAVSGMTSVIIESGDSDINVDFADVKMVMMHRGLALMGVGKAEGENAAKEAVQNAIQSPLLEDMSINGSRGVLVHFKLHPDCSLFEIDEAMQIIKEAADKDAAIIFGTTSDVNMDNNRVEVTLIATGFGNESVEKDEPSKDLNSIRQERFSQLRRKVSGSDFDNAYDELEEPSYLRNKMD
ncbi:MAG: cell division protein FtsZ [Campylobacter sp.]|nr:cell division protein FtsZ [Campylobacter sp.]MBQ7270930.1 cell division protein FtsZ [Campylobacter sp.]